MHFSTILSSSLLGLATLSSAAPALSVDELASYFSVPSAVQKRQSNTSAASSVFPSKAAGDAPYSNTQATLMAAIKIPSTFTFGQKMPVILGPGTGSTGTATFAPNFQKQLANTTQFDPVALDIPDNLMDDIQSNAEFYAFSINYISAMSNGAKVSVITWSQGSMDMQWATKYWPSTRDAVSDFIPISPDLKGSTVVDAFGPFLAIGQAITPVPQSLSQQKDGSNFVKTLNANGGDSAFVPTTSVFSNADEIVMPQLANSTGSGFFLDAHNVGVTNTLVQDACPNQPAGGKFTHEGMLYNPVAFALAMDAMTNPGPGSLSRINLASVCQQSLSPGLSATDKSNTDGLIPLAAENIAGYVLTGKSIVGEPPIKAYAAKDAPAGAKIASS